MQLTFYIASGIAVIATLMVITRHNLIHALLYLVVSFIAIAVVFYILGAPFMAALEMIIYAGAIVVLIIFVIMMLNLKEEAVEQERQWLGRGIFIGPFILSLILLGELIYIITAGESSTYNYQAVDAKGSRDGVVWALRDWRRAKWNLVDVGDRGGISPGKAEEENCSPLFGKD